MSLRLQSLLLVSAAWLVMSASGCSRVAPRAAAAAEPAGGDTALERVLAGAPVRKTLELYTVQPSRIEAFETTPLFAKLAGYVDEIRVDIGDTVRKGDTLVRLWIPELHDDVTQREAYVSQAEAAIEQAQAAVIAAEAAAATAEAMVTQAEAGIGRAGGEHERWKAEHGRLQQLAANGSVTNKLVDETLNQLRAAEAAQQEVEAAVVSAKAVLRQRHADITKYQSDVRSSMARLRVAQADLARSTTLLNYAEIKAPFDGVVTQRNVDTGHFVQPPSGDARPLMVVDRNDKVRIFVDVPEVEAAMVQSGAEGDTVRIQVQALGGKEIEGRVTRTSWSLDANNRSLLTEIDLPNPDGILRPGMYAMTTILLERRADALSLPATAIVRQGADALCCVVRGDTIDRVPVETGLRVGPDIEILSGVAPQDAVVLMRADTLAQGQRVEILPPATP